MKILFIVFILSVAAMDNENIVIPGMICLSALLALLVISNIEERRENGNMQSLRL